MSVNPNITKKVDSDELNLGKIFSALLAKWYYFIIAFIVFVSIAIFYLVYSVRTYQATSTLIVKDVGKGSSTSATMDLLSGDMFIKQTNVANVKLTLQSYTLLSEVIKRLDILNTFYDNSNIFGIPLYKTSPFHLDSLKMNQMYYNSQKFYFTLINEDSYHLSFEYKGWTLPDFKLEKDLKFGEHIKTKYFEFTLNRIDSIPFKADVKDYYFVCEDMSTRVTDLIGNLTTSTLDKDGTVINLVYKDHVPRLTKDVLNTITAVFLENELGLKQQQADTTLKFINNQLAETNIKLQDIEGQVELYKRSNGITSLNDQGGVLFNNMTASEKSKSENESKIKLLDNLALSLKNNSDMSKISLSSVGLNDPLLESLIHDYQELLTKKQGLETAVLTETPQLKALKQQLELKKSSLIENINSIKGQIIIQGQQLDKQLSRYHGEISTMPEKERGLVELQRQLNVTQNIYQTLLQQRQETIISANTVMPDNRVQDVAVVGDKPVAPITVLILAIAIIFSGLFPAIVIFIQNVTRSKVINRDDIDFNTSLPVLGVIGKMKGTDNNFVSHNPKSIVAECFRSIRTNIQLAETGNDKKVIMITSTVAGEGKSYIALNLAVMFAMQSNKTLLIGFDFRKPRLFKEFGLNNDKGLSSYLNGKASITDIVQRTEIAGLDLITAGPIPENPSELLSKKEVADLFKTFRAQYDYIIIDTPPIGVLSDAYVIMKYSDMNLYVIRENYSKLSFIRSLNELNLEGKVWNMQILLNAANLSKKFNANYGHYHGYSGKYRYYADNEVKPGFFKRMFNRE